jgi:DNA-directed RNA polymerase specialized sigma24 family protein
MQHGEQRSDSELLVAARTCSEPFGVFYERDFASVLAFFRRRTAGPEEALDLTAETFAAALASVPCFQPGPEPPQAWHHLEDPGYAEIAGDLRCSESVVRKRVSRGLPALRVQLRKEETS